MAKYSFGDLNGASRNFAYGIGQLQMGVSTNASTMINNANTNWDTKLGQRITTQMKDAYQTWLDAEITSLTAKKENFDSIAQTYATQEEFSFSPTSVPSNSIKITGGDIVNASDENGSFDGSAVTDAITAGKSQMESAIDTAIETIGKDFGLHGELASIQTSIVSSLTKFKSNMVQAIDDWVKSTNSDMESSESAYASSVTAFVDSIN